MKFLVSSDPDRNPDQSRGVLRFGRRRFACALGQAGSRADKREGDLATPKGEFPLRRVLYRADRMAAPATQLPLQSLDPKDGWCDAPLDPAYNRQVKLPYGASAEKLWRDDALYDVIVVLGHNDDPPVANMGSAIFLHVAGLHGSEPDYAPTEGCVALSLTDLLEVLRSADANSKILIDL
jgi:L,D-peptidoglycan transpeptidase YkuD (ErfK/YbiS/YcfS/YnhG family)